MDTRHESLGPALAGRYRFERELGSGGMATVYLAEDLKHHRQVAIKVLKPELTAVLGPERFLREIEITAQLTHPNILTLIDSGTAHGFLYYVMPLVEGESLRERLARQGELPVREVTQILREVADALTYAHQHGVIHRDIKPDNVMLTSRHALVMDFGVAKAVSAATGAMTLTTAGVSIGTPAYMAPEQAAGDPHVDHRVDIWALGVTGYEMLTGRPPFAAATPQAILAAELTEEPEPLSRLRPGVPPALAQVITKCLQKKPADRWQSAEEVLGQLEALTTPSDVVPVTPVVAPRGWACGRRLTIGVASAVGIVGVAAAAALVLSRNHGRETAAASRVVVMPFENRTVDAALDPLGAMAAEWVTQGLAQMPFLTVLDTRGAQAPARMLGAAAGPVAVGRETGAEVVVTGSYFLQADSLQFQAQIASTADGRVLLGVGGVAARQDRPLEGIDQVRQRVVAGLASLQDRDVTSFQTSLPQPPTYAAYREYVEGLKVYFGGGEYRESHRRFQQAVVLDSTFLTARVWAAQTGVLARLYMDEALARRADSLITGLDLLRHRLSPFDRARLDFVLALRASDRLQAYQAALRLVDASPGSVDARREAAISALRVLRPREALRRLEELDPELGLIRGWDAYWSAEAWGRHLLGQHADELTAARRGRRRYPPSQRNAASLSYLYLELRALAALGRIAELDSLVRAESRAFPGQTSLMAFGIAGELMAHGHAESAQRLARYAADLSGPGRLSEPAALEWLDQHISLRREVGDPRCYSYFGQPLEGRALAGRVRDEWLHWRVELGLLVGDAEAAASHADQLRDPDAHGLLRARILAAQGERDAARAALEQLERRALEARGTLRELEIERAGVLVRLGGLERALEVLSEGLSRGAIGSSLWGLDGHAHPDLAPLWGEPRFRALIKPRG